MVEHLVQIVLDDEFSQVETPYINQFILWNERSKSPLRAQAQLKVFRNFSNLSYLVLKSMDLSYFHDGQKWTNNRFVLK